MEGRLSLQRGDDAAAEWVASEFKKAGLQPAASGTYLQPVPLIEFHPDYHHVTDTAEKIDYQKMVKNLRLAYLCGWQFAEEANNPKFVANPGGAAGAPQTGFRPR